MSSGRRIHLLTEGDDDRVVVQQLQLAGLVDPVFEILERDKSREGGFDLMLAAAADGPLAAGKRVLVLRHLDDLSPAGVFAWLEEGLKKRRWAVQHRLGPASPRTACLTVHRDDVQARIAVVAVGLPGDPSLAERSLTRFAMDDFLLLLAKERAVYDAVSEMAGLSYDHAMEKLAKTVVLLRENTAPVHDAKRLLQLHRGLTGFRASAATFAKRLIQKANSVLGEQGMRQKFSPLVDGVEAALRLLSA